MVTPGTVLERFAAFARAALPPWQTAGTRRQCERAYMAGAGEVLALVDALENVDALIRHDDPAWRALGALAEDVAAYRTREGLPAPRRRQAKEKRQG
jgi:hypothetical protein